MKTPELKIHRFCLTSFVSLVQLMFAISSHATTFNVTTTADSGSGSLREAIEAANANAGLDTIAFNITGAGPHTIQPLTALPVITDPVVIDGYTQPGSSPNTLAEGDNAVLMIELDGSLPEDVYWVHGLNITAGNSTIRGLVINRFFGSGIWIEGGRGNVVRGNFIGTDVTGTTGLGNRGYWGNAGVFMASVENVIGGTSPADRNIISGNTLGVNVQPGTNNVIQGNYVGTDASGTSTIPNSEAGINIYGTQENYESIGNVIGGGAPGAGNLISGNGLYGILVGDHGGTVIQGNKIGTDVTGNVKLGNQVGVSVSEWELAPGVEGALIGGTGPGEGNLISGNGQRGLELAGPASKVVQGNLIGTDKDGLMPIGNGGVNGGIGLSVVYASGDLIGGTVPGARNVISGNGSDSTGIQLNQATNVLVQGNFIGTDVTGTQAMGQQGPGLAIYSSSANLIGGTTAEARNVFSGNGTVGYSALDIRGNENKVQGNFIGTDVTGTVALGNGVGLGIYFGDAATNNLIGGSTPGAGNLLSGNNAQAAIFLNGIGISGTLIQGNLIGTDLTGTAPLGNSQSVGVWVAGSSDNAIGGTLPGEGNIIAYHLWNGVTVENYLTPNGFTLRNAIRGNSIFANNQMGIDLGIDGVTPNDPLDADVGPNNLQNYPILVSVASADGSTTFVGSLNSKPNNAFTLDFYSNASCADPSCHYEGESFIGSAVVTTDANGDVAFSVTLPVTLAAGRIVTATATDPDGNTSEFSQRPITQRPTTDGPIAQGPGGHYYQIVRARFGATDFITWDEAKLAAEQRSYGCLQGHLATITTLAEDLFIEDLRVQFVAAAPEHVDPHIAGVEFWVGGYQLADQATPNDGWFWINNEGPISGVNQALPYTDWDPGEPNDVPDNDGEHNTENHLAVGRTGFIGWNDEGNLSFVYGYVIEYEDMTPPTITCPANITVPCSTDLLAPVTFAASASDNCNPSPVITYSKAPGSDFPIGVTTVTCTATDASGNSSSCSFNVTRAALGFSGFLPPIGGANATGGSFASPLRTFKNGSTIPVKFTTSCDGTPVLTGIHRLQAVKYSDATTAASPIDATPQDAATTGSQFRLVDTQWHFNLDTRGAGMSSGIWQLVATLSDGSQHHVWIQIK